MERSFIIKGDNNIELTVEKIIYWQFQAICYGRWSEILIVFKWKIILKLIFYHLGKVKDDMNQPAVV